MVLAYKNIKGTLGKCLASVSPSKRMELRSLLPALQDNAQETCASDVNLSMRVRKGSRVLLGFPSQERKDSSNRPALSIAEHCHNKQPNSQGDEYQPTRTFPERKRERAGDLFPVIIIFVKCPKSLIHIFHFKRTDSSSSLE